MTELPLFADFCEALVPIALVRQRIGVRAPELFHHLSLRHEWTLRLRIFVNAVELLQRQLRAGQVNINYPDWDIYAPFGGYKQSGNGREYADWGIHDFLEVKALIGYGS